MISKASALEQQQKNQTEFASARGRSDEDITAVKASAVDRVSSAAVADGPKKKEVVRLGAGLRHVSEESRELSEKENSVSSHWLVRVALKRAHIIATDRNAWVADPKLYYKGAIPTFIGFGGRVNEPDWTKETPPETTAAWKARFEAGHLSWHFSSSSTLVSRVFEDERAAVVKLALRRRVDSAYCTMSLHVLDLDAEMSEVQKGTIASWMKASNPTLKDLFAEAPGFQRQFELAHRLVAAAIQRGAVDAFVISTGCKGFRVCVDAPELFVKVRVSDITGSRNSIKLMFLPVLAKYFGVSARELEASLDWSIWGDNLGVRSNLHAHGGTTLHPLVVIDGLDGCIESQYGCAKRDAGTHKRLTGFWTSVLGSVPEDPEKDYLIAHPMSAAGRRRIVAKGPAQQNIAKASEAGKNMDEADEADEAIAANGKATKKGGKGGKGKECSCHHDEFEDIALYLASKGWAAQRSSFSKSTPGARFVSVRLTSNGATLPFVCPTIGRAHLRNNGLLRFDRSMGMVRFGCLDEDCEAERKTRAESKWVAMHDGSPGAAPLITQLVESGLKNHFDVARLIAPEVRKKLAYDTVQERWRLYDQGTWRVADLMSQALLCVRDVLWRLIGAAVELCERFASGLPKGSLARRFVPVKLLKDLAQFSGAVSTLNNITTGCQPHVTVGRAKWETHFRGYLPVANCLLHFDAKNGRVSALPYEPQQYVRQEYQAPVRWEGFLGAFQSPDNVVTAQLKAAKTWLLVCNRWIREGIRAVPSAARETIAQHVISGDRKLSLKFGGLRLDATLGQWWTKEERLSWTEMIAYGLSRSAFAEVFYAIEGQPGSAKSSVATWLQQLFGPNNVLIQDCKLISSLGDAVQMDDDGSGHASNRMALLDKAMVFFEEPAPHSFFRQALVKNLSGSSQSGRAAHSKQIESFERSFLMVVIGNMVPKPEDPTDGALRSRMKWITPTKVFVRSQEHRRALEAQLTPEQLATTIWIEADKVKLESVLRDPVCQSAMLAVIADAWKRLVCNQRRQFTTSEVAQRRLDAYFQASRQDQDTALAFFDQRMCVQSNTHVPKAALFRMYEDWFTSEQDAQGFEKGQKLPIRKFLQTIKQATNHVHTVKECERKTWIDSPIAQKRSVRCFVGMGFKNDLLTDFLQDNAWVAKDPDGEVPIKSEAFESAFKRYCDAEGKQFSGPTGEQLIAQAYYRLCDSAVEGTVSIQKIIGAKQEVAIVGVRLMTDVTQPHKR